MLNRTTMSHPLSNLQLELLKKFSREVSDEDVREIKRLISQYFGQKAIKQADQVWEEQGWNDSKANELLDAHLRTPYTRKPSEP